MAEAGFDYPMADFADLGPQQDLLNLQLGQAEDFGYGGVFKALLTATADLGQPSDELSEEEVVAYDTALNGFDLTSGEMPEGLRGCRRVGSVAVDDYRPVDPFDRGVELMEVVKELAATLAFVDHQRSWAQCLPEAGYELDHDNPIFHAASRNFDYLQQATAVIHASDDQRNARDRFGKVLNLNDLGAALEIDQELQDMFDREIKEARADRDCRTAHAGPAQAEAEELAQQILGASVGINLVEEPDAANSD